MAVTKNHRNHTVNSRMMHLPQASRTTRSRPSFSSTSSTWNAIRSDVISGGALSRRRALLLMPVESRSFTHHIVNIEYTGGIAGHFKRVLAHLHKFISLTFLNQGVERSESSHCSRREKSDKWAVRESKSVPLSTFGSRFELNLAQVFRSSVTIYITTS